jgi:hypothetical protein
MLRKQILLANIFLKTQNIIQQENRSVKNEDITPALTHVRALLLMLIAHRKKRNL